jgi:hypothetical protein
MVELKLSLDWEGLLFSLKWKYGQKKGKDLFSVTIFSETKLIAASDSQILREAPGTWTDQPCFTLFCKLPPEIRIEIWSTPCPAREYLVFGPSSSRQ